MVSEIAWLVNERDHDFFSLTYFILYDRLYDANPSRSYKQHPLNETHVKKDTQVEPKHNNMKYTMRKENSGLAENISYHNSDIVET